MSSFADSNYWRERLNTITNLFNEERYHDCIAELKLLLTYHELPPLYRIHAHALFAAALDDWYEADDERERAENIYEITRMEYPRGENAKTDELLDNARKVLDNLGADMLEDRPEDWQERKADLREEYEASLQAEQELMRKDVETAESAESEKEKEKMQ